MLACPSTSQKVSTMTKFVLERAIPNIGSTGSATQLRMQIAGGACR